MVAAVEEELVGIHPLVGVQEQGDFGGPGTAVDKVAVEEEVVLFRGFAGELEDVQQIKVLACDVLALAFADRRPTYRECLRRR